MNDVKKKSCAVTGAGGFIGSNLTEILLHKGYHVRALVHYNAMGSRGHLEEVFRNGKENEAAWYKENRLTIVFGDIQDARCMRDLVEGVDAVCHMAALIGIPYSYVAPQSYVNVNIIGTLNILEACRDAGVKKILHTSTSETLGTARYTPQDEKHLLQGQSPYSATKIGADKLAESYYLSFGLPVTTMRPFNTYGPRQSARAVIPTIISQALSKECSEIKLGALDPVRDLTFVTDTANAYRMVMEAPEETVAGRLYHLGVGEGISIGDLAREILDVLNCEKPVVCKEERVRPEKSEVMALISDNSRIRKEVGWKPEVTLREGIKKTADWIQKNLNQYRPGDYMV